MILKRHAQCGEAPGILHIRIKGKIVAGDWQRRRMAKDLHGPREILVQRVLELFSPPRCIRWQPIHGNLEKLLGSRLELPWLYTSGDGNDIDFAASSGGGNWSLFLPVTNTYLGEVYQIFPATCAHSPLYSLKPLSGSFADTLQLAAKGTAFFRSTVGPLSLPGSNPATASPYLGTEVYGEIDWRPLSDLGLSSPEASSSRTTARPALSWKTSSRRIILYQ